MEHARVQRVAHGEHKEVINSEVKNDNTSNDNYNDNNNERSEVVCTSVHSAWVGGIQSGDLLVSLFFLRTGSSFHIFSITMTDMSSIEYPALLKWVATGFSSILLCTLSAWWLFCMPWRAWPDSPIYC